MSITRIEIESQYLTANDYYNRATFKYADGVHRISPDNRPLTSNDRVTIHHIFKEAFLDFWRALSLGDENAILPLAHCYLHGLGTRQDMKMFGILMHTHKFRSFYLHYNIQQTARDMLNLAYSQDAGDYGYQAKGGGTTVVMYCVKKLLTHLIQVGNVSPDSDRFYISVVDHKVRELMSNIKVHDPVVLKIGEFLSHHGGLIGFLGKAGKIGWSELISRCASIERSIDNSQMLGQNCSASEDNTDITPLGVDKTQDGDLSL